MRTPYTRLYAHLVWSTWDRLPLITSQIEQPIYASIIAKCKALNCDVIALGGISDHVHLLVRFPAVLCIADLVKEVKGSSSHLVTHQLRPGEFFKWQGAYGAFTVWGNELSALQDYILHQKDHHKLANLWPEWEQTEQLDPA